MFPRILRLPFAIGTLCALSGSVHAGPPTAETCTDLSASSGRASANRLYSPRASRCFVLVSQETDTAAHRSYLVTNEGQLQVFNSHGEGPSSTHTSARVFFFFPRRTLPTFETRSDGQLAVTLANSQILRFSPDDGSIVPDGYSGGSVTQAADITFDNRGGVEFPSITSGLILDCGWRRGESPIGDRSRSCVARDTSGNRCTIANTSLFRYADGEPYFRYGTDAELKTALDRLCPRLETGSLLPPPPAESAEAGAAASASRSGSADF